MIPLLSRLATPAAFTAALLSFHLLFTVLGLGATLILIPARLSRYALIFAPVVGACVVSWLGWQSLWLGFAGTNASSPIICVLCCSLLIVPIVRNRNVGVQALVNREVLLAFGIAWCGALALSIPAMAEPNLTTISAGNNDVASYALVERFLMSHAIGDQPGNLLQYLDVPGVAQTVFDALFGSALGGSVLRLESYQLGSVTLGVFALWGAMLLFVIARELFQFRLMTAAFLLAAFSVNETIVYLTVQGFKSQLLAMAIAGAIYCWLLPAVSRDTRPSARELAGGAVLCWGLAAGYPHMLPLVGLPIASYCAALAVRARSPRPLLRGAACGAFLLAGVVALSPSKAAGAYHWARTLKDVSAGWFVPWFSPAAFLGLTGTTAFVHLGWRIEAVLGCLFVAILAAGLLAVRRREPDVFLLAISFLVVITASYGLFLVKGREPSGLGGYKAFKLLSFFAPMVWCSTLLVLREPCVSARAKWIQGILGVALLGGNLIAGGRLIRLVKANHRSVGPELAELAKLEWEPRIRSLNLITSDFWDGMWEASFLFHRNVYRAHRTYYPASEMLGDWTLEDRSDRLLKVAPCANLSVVSINDRFTALRARHPLSAEWERGWQGDERTHRWTTEKVASIRFRARPHDQIRVSLRYSPLDAGNRLSVQLNGALVASCPGAHECDFDTQAGETDNLLELVGSLSPHPPGNGDPRPLGISFTEIRISERACADFPHEPEPGDASGRAPLR